MSFELHGGFTPQNAFGYCFGKAAATIEDAAPVPQDEPPAPKPTTKTPRTCLTCKGPLSKWGRCEKCAARMAAQIAQVARKFPRLPPQDF